MQIAAHTLLATGCFPFLGCLHQDVLGLAAKGMGYLSWNFLDAADLCES